MKISVDKWLLYIAVSTVFISSVITYFIIFDPLEKTDPLYVSGQTLYVKIYEPVIQNNFLFANSDSPTNVKEVTSSSGLFAIFNIEVTNAGSTEIKLFVDENAAEILSTDGLNYSIINLSKFSPKEKEGVNSVDSYPLWGSYVMKRNERLTGFLVFEVDKKFAPDTFTWKSSDNVTIHFIQ